MKRALIVCPGRGSYGAGELGSLQRLERRSQWASHLAAADDHCASQGQQTISALDGMEKFTPSLHMRSDVASTLIYTLSQLNFLALDRDRIEPVAIVGNSLGWYTALAAAGAIDFIDGLRIVSTTGGVQRKQGPIGGQLIYPTVDETWAHRCHDDVIEMALSAANREGFASVSINLGGLLVLAGDRKGIKTLKANLPGLVRGKQRFPLVLGGHSGFHSKLMSPMAEAIAAPLDDVTFRAPKVPLVDGCGDSWRPIYSDPAALQQYTLHRQILEPFDFATAMRVAISEYAPEVLVLLGPGASLGGVVGQILSQMGWRGVHDKDSFQTLQGGPEPILLTA